MTSPGISTLAGDGGVVPEHVWTGSPLAPPQRRAFGSMLEYCFPAESARLAACEHGSDATTVRYLASPDEMPRVEALLAEAHQRAVASPARDARVVYEHKTDMPLQQPRAADVSIRVGEGLFVDGPGMGRLLRVLDEVFLDSALDTGAVEYAAPALVSWQTIERAGYARTAPQHLTTCSVVRHDLAALDRFAAAGGAGRASETQPAGACLAPAVCLHLFAAHAGSTLPVADAGGPLLLTARSWCGRHEAGSVDSPTRRWSYSMREIVCLGSDAQAMWFRREMLALMADLAAAIGLPATIATATDPFFTSAVPDLAEYQDTFELKHELLGRLAGSGDDLAIASVNVHKQHFGLGFGISLPGGGPVHSSCVGFGLERWAHWIAGHLGTDPEDWPPVLRDRVARRALGIERTAR